MSASEKTITLRCCRWTPSEPSFSSFFGGGRCGSSRVGAAAAGACALQPVQWSRKQGGVVAVAAGNILLSTAGFLSGLLELLGGHSGRRS